MKLPNHEGAFVPQEKLVNYLLDKTHGVGRHKAAFFMRFGFTREAWEALDAALREHAGEHDVSRESPSRHGVRYAVDGILQTPGGRTPLVRSVWFVKAGDERPHFVTAYPLRRVDHD